MKFQDLIKTVPSNALQQWAATVYFNENYCHLASNSWRSVRNKLRYEEVPDPSEVAEKGLIWAMTQVNKMIKSDHPKAICRRESFYKLKHKCIRKMVEAGLAVPTSRDDNHNVFLIDVLGAEFHQLQSRCPYIEEKYGKDLPHVDYNSTDTSIPFDNNIFAPALLMMMCYAHNLDFGFTYKI